MNKSQTKNKQQTKLHVNQSESMITLKSVGEFMRKAKHKQRIERRI